MRTAITIGRIHGSGVWEFLRGPESPIEEHRSGFKQLRVLRAHPKYEEVQLWESGAGIVVRHRMAPDGEPGPSTTEDPGTQPASPHEEPSTAPAEAPSSEASAAPTTEPAAPDAGEADEEDAANDFQVPRGKGKSRRT
jgi:hypothetical protein